VTAGRAVEAATEVGTEAEVGAQTDAAPATGLRGRIAANRRAIDVELAADPEARKVLSPALLGLTDALLPRLLERARGTLLDAGAGTQPFRAAVEGRVDRYVAYDIEARRDDVDLIGTVEDMSAVADASVDTLLCSEVLEHVPHPSIAVAEFARIVAPGGSLVLSVPFLARLHEEPYDFYRYTRHGLRTLLDDAGFDVDEIVETGSLCSFLGHQVAVAVLGVTWHVRWLRRWVRALNLALVVRPSVALDRALGSARLLPLGYVVVATRRQGAERSGAAGATGTAGAAGGGSGQAPTR
jgi:SAM-dependent methyltransferase